MPPAARTVERTYLALTLLTTLAASFIWGINTLFLLDAGLNNYVALYHNARQMNWIHACFGIGVTLGPLLMREVLARGLAWPRATDSTAFFSSGSTLG